MPTYLNASDETIVIGGMTFLSGEEKATNKYFRFKPILTTGTIIAVNLIAHGTGYHTGDELELAGGDGGTVSITQSQGVISAIALESGGTGYSVGTKATTGGYGVGCTVEVTVIEALTLSNDAPYVAPIELVLGETSFPTDSAVVLAYPALYLHNMTDAVALLTFNGETENCITIPIGDKMVLRNDETINSLVVSSAGTGTFSVYGLKNKNTIEV